MDEERFAAQAPAAPSAADDDRASREAIAACVQRLSRPVADGRRVIERAAIMAEGANAAAILAWLAAAAWRPEDPPEATAGGSGLHGLRRGSQRRQPPRRYVSPPPAAPV